MRRSPSLISEALPTNCSAMPDLSSLEPEIPMFIALFNAPANNARSAL
jgi:hypothetical protein